ncbi:LTA synthase family protein [Lactobacillus sp. R2/2]|nr:LTA synthase family protein [Lactobacillus sp. R2/2]
MVIHLESFQQFLIDYKWKGKEVTPNLNKLYHAKNTLSFANFYNQVGQGKTSDAEMMLENSLLGCNQVQRCLVMVLLIPLKVPRYLEAATRIYNCGYARWGWLFWNRNNAYKQFGYDYFMPLSYYENKPKYYIGYGLKDKIFFSQSIKYIERLPQPFYLKLITVTNHYPYDLDKKNQSIAKTETGDETVDGYVQTARYLDQAIGQLMRWLKKRV